MPLTKLDTVMKIPFIEGMVPGMGVEAVTGRLCSPAVMKFSLAAGTIRHDEESNYNIFQSLEDFASSFETSAAGTFSLFGVDVSAKASYLKELKYQKNSLYIEATKVLTFHPLDRTAFVLPSVTDYVLSDEAKQMPEEKFRKKYGDYFVAGYISKATFRAMLSCFASDSTSHQEFATEINIKKPDMFSTEGRLKMTEIASKHNVTIRCHVSMTGVEGGSRSESTSLMDIEPKLKMFSETAVGEPDEAVLYHHTLVGANVPSSLEIDPDAMMRIADLYSKSRMAPILLNGCPAKYKRELEKKLKDLLNAIQTRKDQLPSNPVLLNNIYDRFEAWWTEIQTFFAYHALYLEVHARTGKGGVRPLDYHDPLVAISEVFRQRQNKPYTKPGWQEADWVYANADKTIVGYELISRKDHNGGISITDGGLLKSSMKVHSRSDYDRGIDWEVVLYAVDSKWMQFPEQLAIAA
ncbi:MAG: hypothetical protein LAO78_01000 [Acidobacteriia bacterium]|nr:hypothetical protein [Terriglobia bacterium]